MKKVLKCKPPVQFSHVSRVKIIWPGDFSAISDNSCAHANHIATYIKKIFTLMGTHWGKNRPNNHLVHS